ncbi:MAG: hypothetical protein PHU25_20025 [Deltaproteobacteria bacterium]|nr:hypothetical protein [Deltaproteobacteria bacterium]
MRACLLAVAIAIVAVACGRSEKVDPSVDKLGRATGPAEPVGPGATLPVGHPSLSPGAMNPHGRMDQMSGASGATAIRVGTVLETIDVPNYTYIRFKDATGEEHWAAVPSSKLSAGEEIRIAESMVMRDFRSPSLNRVFPAIIFGTLKVGDGASAPDAGVKPPHPNAAPSAPAP